MNWFTKRLRKSLISLKRNFYVVPLLLVAVCCMEFTFQLGVISDSCLRISQNYCSLFVFIITLLSILNIVVYLNYMGKATKVGEEKKSIPFFILYFVMCIAQVGLEVFVLNKTKKVYNEELAVFNDPNTPDSEIFNMTKFIGYEKTAISSMTAHLILIAITTVVVIAAPFIQKALKKVKFSQMGEVKQQ